MLAGRLLKPWPMEVASQPAQARRLHVLYLTHRVPFPLDKGEKIRSFHAIRALAARGHRVHLLALRGAGERHPSDPLLTSACASVVTVSLSAITQQVNTLRALLDSRPLSLGHFASRRMQQAVQRRLATTPIDVIVACSATMLQFVPAAWLGRTVADLVDADSEKWRQYAATAGWPRGALYRLEARRLRAFEAAVLQACRTTMVVSDREAGVFSGPRRPDIVTVAVDTDHFARAAGAPAIHPGERRACYRLVFVGSMDYRPNIDAVRHFADAILPLISVELPGVCFTIVGREPAPAVKRLSTRAGITVTGSVDDVRPYLWNADACVVPLRLGRGIQNKMLEAMAAGCPVICSTQASAGLDAAHGSELLVSDAPAGFAAAVVQVLSDGQLRDALRRRALDYVNRTHAIGVVGTRFADLVSAAGRMPSGEVSTCAP